jgi:nucleoid-associated protein YgaU
MNASGPESVSSAIKQAEASGAQISGQVNNPGLGADKSLPSAGDIAHARSFFVPKAEIPALSSPLTGIEHSGAAAVKAAEAAISPMLQLIMRLPGHLGLFSSFLEALTNLFIPHELLSNFDFGNLASGIDLNHLVSTSPVTHVMGNLTNHFHSLHSMSAEMINSVGTAHLHVNPFDALKQSMNVSAGVDLNHPQFEGASSTLDQSALSARGDSLAGPGLSTHAITPKLSPVQRIFSSKSFEAGNNYSNANNLLAFNNQSPATGMTNTTANTTSSSTGSNSALNDSASESTSALFNDSLPAQNSSQLGGLHAKALSLKSVMHKGHNPFSKLASSTKQAFQVAQKDISNISNASYSIKSGDTLWKIANRELGSGARWKDIYNLNQDKLGSNPGLIYSGTSINLPGGHNSIPNMSDHSIMAHKSSTHQYTIKPGDNLWQISKNVFGTGDKWTQLYKINSTALGDNPGMIFSGQKLALSGSSVHSIQPHMQTHSVEQLAHHTSPSTHVVHKQPALSHENTIAHGHSQSIHEHTVTPHQQSIAHQKPSITPQLKQQTALPDTRIAHHPVQNTSHGLTVESAHHQILSGAGGAQAHTSNTPANTHAPNKLSGLSAVKGKSVVSFSLAPDLAQW